MPKNIDLLETIKLIAYTTKTLNKDDKLIYIRYKQGIIYNRLNPFFKNVWTCLEFLDKSGNYTINSIESTSLVSLHKNLLRKSGIKNSQTRRIAENLISVIITKKKKKSYDQLKRTPF